MGHIRLKEQASFSGATKCWCRSIDFSNFFYYRGGWFVRNRYSSDILPKAEADARFVFGARYLQGVNLWLPPSEEQLVIRTCKEKTLLIRDAEISVQVPAVWMGNRG